MGVQSWSVIQGTTMQIEYFTDDFGSDVAFYSFGGNITQDFTTQRETRLLCVLVLDQYEYTERGIQS